MFSDKFRQYSSRVYAERREYIAKNTADIIAAQKDDMRTALEYLYGTLLLDELNSMNPNLQSKLLRVLEERKVDRIGSDKSIDVDVRVIAAPTRTFLPWWKMAASGRICSTG